MQAESDKRPWIKLAVTAALLLIYKALRFLPLPGINREVVATTPISDIWWLGIGPFVVGFLLVEFYSLLTPGGRRLRAGGADGRRKLNKGAFLFSVLIATLQSYALYHSLSLVTPEGSKMIPNPGVFSQLAVMSSIVAISTVAFYLCRSITLFGLGNGFCWLFILDFFGQWNIQEGSQWGWSVVVCLVVAAIMVYLQRGDLKDRSVDRTGIEEEAMLLGWPQGIVPLSAGLKLPILLITFGALLGIEWPWSASGLVSSLITIVSIPILSWICLHLFSTRKRIEHNASSASLSEGYDVALKYRFLVTTVVSTVLVAAYIFIDVQILTSAILPSLITLLATVAVGTDVLGEWRFRSRYGELVSLIELDNVHLANHLFSALRRAQIPCFLQAFHLRSLLFFFGPLYKMRALVPHDQQQEACDLIAQTDTSIR